MREPQTKATHAIVGLAVVSITIAAIAGLMALLGIALHAAGFFVDQNVFSLGLEVALKAFVLGVAASMAIYAAFLLLSGIGDAAIGLFGVWRNKRGHQN